MVQVPKSVVWEDIIIQESKWFVANEHDVYKKVKFAYENEHIIKERAKSLMRINREKFSLTKMSELFNTTFDRILESAPTNVKLKLPKLKKVNTDQPKIKLPKLKKVK
jgi:hypothetical protein